MSASTTALLPSDQGWPRRVWRLAVLVVAGGLGYITSVNALLLVLHGLGVDFAGELDLQTGERRGLDGFSGISAVLLLLTAVFTAKIARRYRSSEIVTGHPVASRLLVWPAAVACFFVAMAAYDGVEERSIRQDITHQLARAGIGAERSACIADGLAASFDLDQDRIDTTRTTTYTTMLAVALTCELSASDGPCVIEELVRRADPTTFERPIDVFLAFEREVLTPRDVEATRRTC